MVDWHEVWSRAYWREYLGRAGGAVGQPCRRRACGSRSAAFCFSRLHRDRLLAGGVRGSVDGARGRVRGRPDAAGAAAPAEPVAVFAGRHIPEKQAPALVPAIRLARAAIPELRGEIYGDGPERPQVLAAIEREGLDGVVVAPGLRRRRRASRRALRRALCMVLPSRREGYGLVVVEAAARGTPSVVVRGEDNAAVELVDDGENGVIAASASPEDLAAAIVRVHERGRRRCASRTRDWFARNARAAVARRLARRGRSRATARARRRRACRAPCAPR